MIDLHTHTLLSDGVLLPTELAQRAKVIGYRVIGITDHADSSNLEHVATSLLKVRQEMGDTLGIKIICGVELTHVPPQLLSGMVDRARSFGCQLVIVHGQTIVEPVEPGTNRAALECDIDILAHPGLISDDDVKRAAARDICLEITTRAGHSYTNGHVAQLAKKYGARLVLNTDSHGPSDLITSDFAKKVVLGAGLGSKDFDNMRQNAEWLVKKIETRK
ncbi:MAG: histidinol phosphate phosphatase domain-containing protein [Candidatus Ancaeobacter aquaticus]|nr:histidinol phosphate phosphatase domain-containing protein [Candidatus Ancaeobacter aquaticus]